MMHSMDNLKKLNKFDEHTKGTTDAFWAYNKHVFADGAISAKNKELIALAVALTTQCAYCIEVHKGNALKAGATEAEFAELTHVAAAISAGGAVTHGTHLF